MRSSSPETSSGERSEARTSSATSLERASSRFVAAARAGSGGRAPGSIRVSRLDWRTRTVAVAV
ncbi:hypothetical protein [Conexibacter sp. W3-3-2]|uniref:hypothetical protein n=1 Tax=Conexibacter sp. W3-3-2 TaxID=2675227 RepID=UPI0018AAAC9E|nr:hypothetical protein [Conexibacter sp. W3-3-2]